MSKDNERRGELLGYSTVFRFSSGKVQFDQEFFDDFAEAEAWAALSGSTPVAVWAFNGESDA